jgi:aryl-alcohol dehydrogenase-like predicted oxidoreductase
MGFDYLDHVYSWSTEDGRPVQEIVESVGALIAAGKVRAWGTGNWEPEKHAAAARVADEIGVPRPCAAQLPYNLVARGYVETSALDEALDASGASVVASYVLDGGALTGKYADRSAAGRHAGRLDEPRRRRVLETAGELHSLAVELDTTAAALAIAFALANERVATVLFGATSSEQVAENVRAVELLERLTPAEVDRLQAIGSDAP